MECTKQTDYSTTADTKEWKQNQSAVVEGGPTSTTLHDKCRNARNLRYVSAVRECKAKYAPIAVLLSPLLTHTK